LVSEQAIGRMTREKTRKQEGSELALTKDVKAGGESQAMRLGKVAIVNCGFGW
jgi:hypothetical protein